MTFRKSIITMLATGSIFASTFLTPLAMADTTINGNGAVSDNNVTTTQNTNTSVNQNNNATITNTVNTSASTGGNSADYNTGGSSAISTGNASNTTDIVNKANANIANLGGCNTCSTGTSQAGAVVESGNGAFSNNTVKTNSTNTTSVGQTNNAYMNNAVSTLAQSGGNDANYNTGGNTTVLTGNATNNTSIDNMANVNIASVPGAGNGGIGSATISGNGAASDNKIKMNNNNSATVTQNNYANIVNKVWSAAKTGNNDANFNTGGSVLVATGAAANNTDIQNMANFNAANLASCGCQTSGNGDVSIWGNGAFAKDTVTNSSNNTMNAAQHNAANIANTLKSGKHSGTGNNSASDNTASGGSSLVLTGDANSATHLSTAANVNSVDNGVGFNLGGTDFRLLFDMGSLLNQLHL